MIRSASNESKAWAEAMLNASETVSFPVHYSTAVFKRNIGRKSSRFIQASS